MPIGLKLYSIFKTQLLNACKWAIHSTKDSTELGDKPKTHNIHQTSYMCHIYRISPQNVRNHVMVRPFGL